jgi:DNA-binding NarL/FixJ family response regulator
MKEDFQSGAGISHCSAEPASAENAWPLLPVCRLSPRQLAILKELATGKPNKGIGKALEISPETVKHHLKTIFLRLGVQKRKQAVEVARYRVLIP